MNDTLTLPPHLAIRDLLLTAFARKGRLFLIFFCVMAIALAVAVLIRPDYKTKATLLVLLGTEHSFRPPAGQQFVNTGGADVEQVLRTEASILASRNLHRDVIQQIGIGALYPRLVRKPNPVVQWSLQMIRDAATTLGMSDPVPNSQRDILSRAATLFARNLTIDVDRKSMVISLAFTNPDADVSARALRLLIDRYLELRTRLYNDVQAPIIAVRLAAVHKQLDAADAALAGFKAEHNISNFAERRAILLKQQGDLELAMHKADAMAAEETARVKQLNQQLDAMTGTSRGQANAAAALQGMVRTFQRQQREAETRYIGSPAVVEARRQMLDRETDIARMQAAQAYGVQTERDRAAANLRSSLAGHAAIATQLAALKKQVTALDGDETQLRALERNRALLETDYQAVSKILDERQTIEAVEAQRQSSVRVIQPPRVPALPLPTRKLILLAGMVISVLLGIGSILMAHFFQAIYLRPEALEMDTGLTVLASVPELRALGTQSRALRVVPG